MATVTVYSFDKNTVCITTKRGPVSNKADIVIFFINAFDRKSYMYMDICLKIYLNTCTSIICTGTSLVQHVHWQSSQYIEGHKFSYFNGFPFN